MQRAIARLLISALLIPAFASPPFSARPAFALELPAGTEPFLISVTEDPSHEHTSSVDPTVTPSADPTLTAPPGDSPMPGGSHDHDESDSTVPVHRVGGPDRFARAIELSRSTYETGTARSAVIVNGYSYYHSIAAASLAGAVNGPILPTALGGLNSRTLAELKRLGVRSVYIVGNVGSVPTRVGYQLSARGYKVTRVAGPDHYATAAAVARKVASILGVRSLDTAFVVNSERPWDALSVSPYAYSRKIPVLFVNSRGVPSATSQVLSGLRFKKAIVVGSRTAIDSTTYSRLAARTPAADVRLTASTRFNMAVRVSRYAIQRGWATASHPVIANGADLFVDGLIGGPHAGAKGSVLLLTASEALPLAGRQFLAEKAAAVDHVMVIGTTSAVSDGIVSEVRSLL